MLVAPATVENENQSLSVVVLISPVISVFVGIALAALMVSLLSYTSVHAGAGAVSTTPTAFQALVVCVAW